MKAVDDYIPQPDRPIDQPFLMPIEDCVDLGARHGGDGAHRARRHQGGRGGGDRRHPRHAKSTVTGVEMFRKLLDQGGRAQRRLPVARHRPRGVERGQVLCKPGSIKPHKKFKAEYILTKRGGPGGTPLLH